MASKGSKGSPQQSKKATPTSGAQPATPSLSDNRGPTSADADPLHRLYSSLLRCRLVQERVQELCAANEVAPGFAVRIGHEAVTVGATADLGPEDTIAGSHHDLAALIARGVPLAALLAANGAAGSTASMFSQQSFPEDPFNFGTGVALAHKLDQRRRVVVAFCAQEKPPLQSWHDALKSAAAQKLPIIFVIENGTATEGTTKDGSPHLKPVSFLAREYGFPGIIVDGADAVAVWRVAQESVHRARNGSGPTLIDCRSDASRDPLERMERYLKTRRLWDEQWRARLERELMTEIKEALAKLRRAATSAEIPSRLR
jgi:TPP-dependent pyruvate/acetoin dehydrogenase alpha subunit